MAKLLSYYRLCPLIDSKSLLGISNDNEPGVVIVTLGPNIVIKYRLSDQKQICSWRTRDKFSSRVLYDKKQQKYIGVFNKSFIRLWTNDDENLDKIKKIKFNHQIYDILLHNEETYVFFIDGSLYSLSDILEERKTFAPERNIDNEVIYDILYTSVEETLYFGFLVKREDNYIFYWSSYTKSSRNNFNSLHIEREQIQLNGYGLHLENGVVNFLSIWNDGRIYTQLLKVEAKRSKSSGELFTVLENISEQHLVKIVNIDENYIAVYGADPNDEGASLLIYNTQFKVNQSKQSHKLYTTDAKIWRVDNNIFLPVGQNLIVAPFCLESEQLAALVGSHKPLPNKSDADILFVTEFEVADWRKGSIKGLAKIKNKKLSVSLQEKVEEYIKQGLPECLIVEQILSDILESKDVLLLQESLNFFMDIPEKYLVFILKFILSSDKKLFIQEEGLGCINAPQELSPFSRIKLLDQVLIRKFSDAIILPYLRSHLPVENVVVFLKYLIFLLSEDGHTLPKLPPTISERCILRWTSLLMDSNYQKFVLSKDSAIENVLTECKNIIMSYVAVIDELKQISPTLLKLYQAIKGKKCNVGFTNDLYCVEQLNLY